MLRHYTNAMRNYAIFGGRASRAEFWWFHLVFLIMLVVVVVLDQTYFGELRQNSGVITLLFAAVHILPSMAVQVRRLHDIDWSGWAILINLVPFGTVVLLILACLAGTDGANRFGARSGNDMDDLASGSVPRRQRVPTVREPAFTDAYEPASGDLEPPSYPGSASPANSAPSALSRHDMPTVDRDPIADIERLAKLRDNGSITEAEFQAMKAKTMAANR